MIEIPTIVNPCMIYYFTLSLDTLSNLDETRVSLDSRQLWSRDRQDHTRTVNDPECTHVYQQALASGEKKYHLYPHIFGVSAQIAKVSKGDQLGRSMPCVRSPS